MERGEDSGPNAAGNVFLRQSGSMLRIMAGFMMKIASALQCPTVPRLPSQQ